jgi:DNA-binding transcriptional LysR family regulator
MTLQQLNDFISVVEFGGFRAAARALGVSQGGLTKSIARLEADYALQLICRNSAGLVLTDDGQAFLPLAKSVATEATIAGNWLQRRYSAVQSVINLGMSFDPATRLRLTVMKDFQARYATTALNLSPVGCAEAIRRLRDNSLDIAIVRVQGAGVPDDIEASFLYEGVTGLYARAGHPRAGAMSMGELLGESWVTLGDGGLGEADSILAQLFDDFGYARPANHSFCATIFDALTMMLERNCIARLPRVLNQHPLVRGKLALIAVNEPSSRYRVAILRRKAKVMSSAAQVFYSMASSYYRSLVDETAALAADTGALEVQGCG